MKKAVSTAVAAAGGKTVAAAGNINRVGLTVEAIAVMLTQIADYKKALAAENTKQEQIRAQRDVIIAQIKSRRELILNASSQIFSERREALAHIFDNLEQAVQAGDVGMVGQMLGAVVTVVKHSPLADVQALAKEIEGESYTLDLS